MLAAVLWCLVVVVGAAVVWQAIDAAGRGIFSGEAGPVVTPTPSTTPSDDARTPEPEPSRSSSVPSPSDTTTDASPSPSTSEPSAPSTQSRAWQGREGRVEVRCSGVSASLVSASPADGYAMEVDKRGPDEVRVEFSRGDQELRVDARCAGGVPAFEADQSGSSG